jgi:DNA-binding HxlR family transcriptional regulator
MDRISFADMRCSLGRSLEVIGDWWTPLILRDLFLGVSRFDDLVADLGMSRNLLARRLKWLVGSGVVEKRAYSQRPLRHDYVLTRAGEELVPVLLALAAWGDRWVRPREGVPLRFVHKTCGGDLKARVTCGQCGGAVEAADVVALPGPGLAELPGTMVVARRLKAKAAT